jgi:hypothetical protein
MEGVPLLLDLAHAALVQAAPFHVHESTARAVAMRSSAWSSAPHAAHQIRMSASEGAAAPFSIRVVFAGCQPHRSESSFPVRPASLRRCCNRTASASRAA